MSARALSQVDRLLWRAGFGARVDELERYASLGLEGSVDRLLAPPAGAALERGPRPHVGGRALDPLNTWGHDVLWYLDRTVRARHPLVERMTLTWHDHFAVSNAKVGVVELMLAYYRTLRRHALGRFRDLAQAMAADSAMRLWLDIVDSNRDAPNENFARELFELFTLGANQGYDERDIREAARAFTGVTYDYRNGRFAFDPSRHDGGVKRVLGRRGRFGARDIVDIAVADPHHAPFLCGKLWAYVTPRPCPAATLRRLVRTYRAADTDVRPVLRRILTDPEVYADPKPDQVKPPVVYVAGMLRRIGHGVDTDSWSWLLDGMGQRPFYPPNVGGWSQDLGWLSTATVQSRFLAAAYVLGDHAVADGSIPSSQTPQRALRAALSATGQPTPSGATLAGLRGFARASVKGRTAHWQVTHYWPERQRALRHMLLAGPEAQLS